MGYRRAQYGGIKVDNIVKRKALVRLRKIWRVMMKVYYFLNPLCDEDNVFFRLWKYFRGEERNFPRGAKKKKNQWVLF